MVDILFPVYSGSPLSGPTKQFVDLGNGIVAEKIVVVNPDGSPIAGGGAGGGGDANAANQDISNDLLNDIKISTTTIGTRSYGTPIPRLTIASVSAQSEVITATEILVHSSTRCFILAGINPTATTNCIPLEAGEKFHLRITSGHKIAAIRDTADGFLNIIPVA